jgi:hypothetical protein
MRFDKALPYSLDLVIPGFERSYPPGIFKTLALSDKPSEVWFQEFVGLSASAIGSRYLPIYRMADGEYRFAVGYRFRLRGNDEPLLRYLWARGKSIVWRTLHWGRNAGIDANPGKGKGWESGRYTAQELATLRAEYVTQLQSIAQNGVLAMLLSYRRTQFAQQYFVPILQWMRRNGIELTTANYYPFYFVYAFLNGPQRKLLYAGRRVLVVTSFDDKKREAIERSLRAENVADVQFIPISRNRSMYDRIDLSVVNLPVDLVLVGAGIGASNILLQLRPLNTLAIDAGYCIECLANPERKKERTFCWPDAERNGNFEPI